MWISSLGPAKSSFSRFESVRTTGWNPGEAGKKVVQLDSKAFPGSRSEPGSTEKELAPRFARGLLVVVQKKLFASDKLGWRRIAAQYY